MLLLFFRGCTDKCLCCDLIRHSIHCLVFTRNRNRFSRCFRFCQCIVVCMHAQQRVFYYAHCTNIKRRIVENLLKVSSLNGKQFHERFRRVFYVHCDCCFRRSPYVTTRHFPMWNGRNSLPTVQFNERHQGLFVLCFSFRLRLLPYALFIALMIFISFHFLAFIVCLGGMTYAGDNQIRNAIISQKRSNRTSDPV